MISPDPLYRFLSDGVSFQLEKMALGRLLYFPLCGTDAAGLKSAITPFLSGDIKIDKNRYLTKPQSREDLRQDVRNFFVDVQTHGVFSLTQESSPETALVEAGQLWHRLVRRHPAVGLELSALNFIPVSGETVGLMRVIVKNIGPSSFRFTPTAAVPIFGRPLANKHDHEHVSSLFHRLQLRPWGVVVQPTMRFNEEGHRENSTSYFVFGVNRQGEPPCTIFPTVESFYGEKGTPAHPSAVGERTSPPSWKDPELQGKEAMGALRFKEVTLSPNASVEFLIVMGVAEGANAAEEFFRRFDSLKKFDDALKDNQNFWGQKTETIELRTVDADFNAWFKWVTLQPVLRRIFGNSFLPDHDYGKGGKGWRDLWQDLLSLILIEPELVRSFLLNNFAGVRIDGSNATIIGTGPGEFLADRNMITRIWMDHGCWPLLTVLLYINQTGDMDILMEETTYFRDPQFSRTLEKDLRWTPEYGHSLKTRDGQIYCGTVLEHLLVQNLVQFFNVGEHNITRLENADWNDGLDMAFDRGESVAFMSMYAGNLLALAELLEELKARGAVHGEVAMEMIVLLDTLTEHPCDYDEPQAKRHHLFETYCRAVQPEVSGQKLRLKLDEVASDLRKKGRWMFDHIRRTQKVTVEDGRHTYTWFNGYYDNKGRCLEGRKNDRVWMTLIGQVFPLMSGLASAEETRQLVASVDHFLKDPTLGGYRLNTDFGVPHYLDLGRAFGFAYGTKENGAYFSHMTVMYAYGLYQQGLAREGYRVLTSIYRMCRDSSRARIYPGVPEYFDTAGRGMYPYLTGSASWFIMTVLNQAFGLRGQWGDLIVSPQLVSEQFSPEGVVEVRCLFAGKKMAVTFDNKELLDCNAYQIGDILMNGQSVEWERLSHSSARIKRSQLAAWPEEVSLKAILQSR